MYSVCCLKVLGAVGCGLWVRRKTWGVHEVIQSFLVVVLCISVPGIVSAAWPGRGGWEWEVMTDSLIDGVEHFWFATLFYFLCSHG